MPKDSTFLIIDIDSCPITDNPVIKHDCASCKYYSDFEIVTERPAVKCSWTYDSD